jgi:hypothetical protein
MTAKYQVGKITTDVPNWQRQAEVSLWRVIVFVARTVEI